MNANASNSEMRVINHKNANKIIQNKAKDIIPRTLSLMENNNHNIRVFYYINKDNNIIGNIVLKKIEVTSPQSLVGIISGKVVYVLSINIFVQYQKRGYATDFLGQILHKIINEEDAFIYLTDITDDGIGEKLYAGQKVVTKFDVYHIFNGKKGSYLIGRKTDKERVHYVKLNKNDPHDPQLEYCSERSNQKNSGKMHRNGYLRNNPPNSLP